MNIPQIQMQSQSAQIAIQSRPAVQSIQQPKAHLQMKQQQATMTMRTIPGKLTIDQSQAWEDMDIKVYSVVPKKTHSKAKQALLQGIARVSAEGDEMLNLHTGRNVIVEQARRQHTITTSGNEYYLYPFTFCSENSLSTR